MPESDATSNQFYRHSMRILERAQVPFLLVGAYAYCVYTGIARHTKDFDLFVRQEDFERALAVLQKPFLVGWEKLSRAATQSTSSFARATDSVRWMTAGLSAPVRRKFSERPCS